MGGGGRVKELDRQKKPRSCTLWQWQWQWQGNNSARHSGWFLVGPWHLQAGRPLTNTVHVRNQVSKQAGGRKGGPDRPPRHDLISAI